MSGPHADYECSGCSVQGGYAKGIAIVHEDLPVLLKFCPHCGTKAGEGFEQLLNAVNVMSGNTRETGKLVEHELKPLYDEHSSIKQSAKRFESGAKEAMEKAYEKATTAERRNMKQITHEVVPVNQTGMPVTQSFVHERPFGMPITRRIQPIIENRKR
jgi:ElaB/YqjD/DUF883 family membrane-anchored ribosome-binding protein